MVIKQTVNLVIDKKARKILLRRKPDKVGKGKWNGPGGHVEKDEKIVKAAIRELEEESGLIALKIKEIAVAWSTYKNKNRVFQIHFFLVTEFVGDIKKDEEIKWFELNNGSLPYKKMWPSDEHILPRILKGKKLACWFHYLNENVLLWHKVKEVFAVPQEFDIGIFED